MFLSKVILSGILSADVLAAIITVLGSIVVSFYGVVQINKIRRRSIVKKYREFLGYSAWALQERIHNILYKKDFADYFDKTTKDSDVYSCNLYKYTLFLFCQFFAWREIINREMYNFRFRRCGYDSRILRKLLAIEHWFSIDSGYNKISQKSYYKKFMIFRGEQRVLGDFCVCFNEKTNYYECISFSEFIDKKRGSCFLSIEKLEKDVQILLDDKKKNNSNNDYQRLATIRNSLLDLLDELDPKQKRHPECREYCDLEKPDHKPALSRVDFHKSDIYKGYEKRFKKSPLS